jgi:hypothetical protein
LGWAHSALGRNKPKTRAGPVWPIGFFFFLLWTGPDPAQSFWSEQELSSLENSGETLHCSHATWTLEQLGEEAERGGRGGGAGLGWGAVDHGGDIVAVGGGSKRRRFLLFSLLFLRCFFSLFLSPCFSVSSSKRWFQEEGKQWCCCCY